MISVNTVITVAGKQCILMRDLLGNAPSDKYTFQNQGSLEVWYEEDALRETRENHPETPVFGFWQTLIASGLVNTDKALQFIYTNENRDFGYYLYSREGTLHTGSLFQGELQRLPGPAIADGITLDDGEEISVTLDDLKLPQYPLRTHKERVIAATEEKKKFQQLGFLTFAVIAGVGLLADTGLAYKHDQHTQAFQEANKELHVVEQTLDEVNKQKLVEWPSQTSSLSVLYQITSTLADSKLSGEFSLLANKTASIEVQDTTNREAKLALLADRDIHARPLSASTTVIEWVNRYDN